MVNTFDKNNSNNSKLGNIVVIIGELLAVAIIIIILVTGFNHFFKVADFHWFVYGEGGGGAFSLGEYNVKILDSENTSCSNNSMCSKAEVHKVTVNVSYKDNSYTKYVLNSKERKYYKIPHSDEYVRAGIYNNKVAVSLYRNYTLTDIKEKIIAFFF